MAKGAFITQKKYDDVKRLIETKQFNRREIASLVGVSMCTVSRIKGSENLEEYKMSMRGGLPKDKPEENVDSLSKQVERLNDKMDRLLESNYKVGNMLDLIHDILKRYMEV